MTDAIEIPTTSAAAPSAMLQVAATREITRCEQLDDDIVRTMQGVMLRYERNMAIGQLPVALGGVAAMAVALFRPVPSALFSVVAVLLGGTFLLRPCATWLLGRKMAKLGLARPLTLALLKEIRWLAFRNSLGTMALPDARDRLQAREASSPPPPWLEPTRHA